MKIHWTVTSCWQNLWRKLTNKMFLIKIVLRSLYYNQFNDCYYFMDTLMEPLFWFVDHFTKALGPIFVALVVMLMAIVVSVAYFIGLPYWLHHSLSITSVAVTIGHWLLINVIFHYYMAFVTLPGFPPEGALIPEAVSICKKCIAPKPPRTHHCSICNRCILKMDHHCPWLNNCIGHFNHRYFFLYCVYTWFGVVFLMVFGYDIAYDHFYIGHEGTILKSNFSVPKVQENHLLKQLLQTQYLSATDFHEEILTETLYIPYLLINPERKLYHSILVFVTLICISVFLALGALTMWHARLITLGQTSIEAHINKKETKRLLKESKIYRNPYNFGAQSNWKLFLGLVDGRGWRHVLLPSRHTPAEGDGLRWHTKEKIYSTVDLFK